jgi:YD repeat-containing protein
MAMTTADFKAARVVDRNSRKREFSYNDLGLVTEEVWVDGFGNAVKTIGDGGFPPLSWHSARDDSNASQVSYFLNLA